SGEPAPAAAENTPAAAPPTPLDKRAAKTTAGKPKEKPAQKAPPTPAKPAEPELDREQEHELGIEEEQLVPAYDRKPPEPPARAPSQAAEPGPLMEVFEEFRAELGEMGAEEEDLETHYNLGTAFREMGLLEEAISEFQKVAKASDNGRAFRYTMQCCTLLGLAF